MNYNDYQKARNASWQVLIDCKIAKLPTDLSQICRHYGIRIVKSSDLSATKLLPGERGRSVQVDDQFFIIVRDTTAIQSQRYTIAHELGHILLNTASEYIAERFAIDILAPACVLWGLQLRSAEDIARVCNISAIAAEKRAQRMAVLYQRNMFLTAPMERQLFDQFKDYIRMNSSTFDS